MMVVMVMVMSAAGYDWWQSSAVVGGQTPPHPSPTYEPMHSPEEHDAEEHL